MASKKRTAAVRFLLEIFPNNNPNPLRVNFTIERLFKKNLLWFVVMNCVFERHVVVMIR